MQVASFQMSNIARFYFDSLTLSGSNYLKWKLSAERHLEAFDLQDTLKESNTLTPEQKAGALNVLIHHIHEDLKKEYLTVIDPADLWKALKERYVTLPTAISESRENTGKLSFCESLKKPGPIDGPVQCFIKRDKSEHTYHLYLSLSPDLLEEDGKFLLSAKRVRHTICSEYILSKDADNISRSSNSYVGKLRSKFLGTKFVIYDTLSSCNAAALSQMRHESTRFYSKKVPPKIPYGSYRIALVTYEMKIFRKRGPRVMNCIMYSIPTSALNSMEDFSGLGARSVDDEKDEGKGRPLVLKSKAPRWHEQLQCWCLNFRARVTVASVKNFQLIAAAEPPAGVQTPSQPPQPIILQFGKVGKDTFTMDYRYPLSAFQAFAICLSSFDTKIACE